MVVSLTSPQNKQGSSATDCVVESCGKEGAATNEMRKSDTQQFEDNLPFLQFASNFQPNKSQFVMKGFFPKRKGKSAEGKHAEYRRHVKITFKHFEKQGRKITVEIPI